MPKKSKKNKQEVESDIPIWIVEIYEDSYKIHEASDPKDYCVTCMLEAIIEDLDCRAGHDDADEDSFSA